MHRGGVLRLCALLASFTLLLTVLAEGAHAQAIAGFTPTEGPLGTEVTITGSDFSLATDVQFNGTGAPFTIDSDTQIRAVVPEGATTGPIAVVTPDGTATGADPFTATKPNIVLIVTDDQRWDELRLPTVQSELIEKGAHFVNGFVVNPLCCPSRATNLTGKYSHGTDIYSNGPPHGGFDTFKPQDGSTIATWLHGAGYRTALVGKYLNGYTQTSYVAPGWDRWVAFASRPPQAYYNYTLSVDGTSVTYGSQPSDYSTDVLAGYATSLIDSVQDGQPLFLYLAPLAPHAPTTVAPRYQGACPGLQPLRPPSYNEADVSDKPLYIRSQKRLSRAKKSKYDAEYLRHCQSLLSVDDLVRDVLDALQSTGRLSSTLIVFTSDNGFLFGEHRWHAKVVPYEESIRVPMVVRYDPMTRDHATLSNDLLLNLDYAPTFAAAGGVPALGAEGMDFLPLLADPGHTWRTDFLIEHWTDPPRAPTYCAVRNEHFMYVDYVTGEEELYDLDADPYELQNVASDPSYAGVRSQLHDRLVQLCSPPPPGFTP